ncbi:DUF192 domain-containing protein [Jiella sp. MQZ9-1]|uniref:DUF192 domain-containing protein n=1 Tax=Jiella flava TaxID=2816857 RepID=A0A939FZE1_9HYPH|nr:DUF192 domain-containing protein [Jiella flava]MBO0664395.1 DUF192 domain-containing protein [Jiella flava]MCD2473030.1 DUF192 domain-containing protein [Jiella flava]
MTSKTVFGRVVIAALALAIAGYVAGAFAGGDLIDATIVTKSGRHPIRIELAVTPKEREVGLMNRESLPRDHGMLFRFDETRDVAMWMKNTLIPLDMLFMDEHGKIVTIKTNAQPLSLDIIPSERPVRYVLELNGGAAARYDVSLGDRLDSTAIQGE